MKLTNKDYIYITLLVAAVLTTIFFLTRTDKLSPIETIQLQIIKAQSGALMNKTILENAKTEYEKNVQMGRCLKTNLNMLVDGTGSQIDCYNDYKKFANYTDGKTVTENSEVGL